MRKSRIDFLGNKRHDRYEVTLVASSDFKMPVNAKGMLVVSWNKQRVEFVTKSRGTHTLSNANRHTTMRVQRRAPYIQVTRLNTKTKSRAVALFRDQVPE